jgi:hypothetical protein
VSQFIDKSEKDTLPEPDLNPLLNPLLAANMGRWAEVYFTSAPERRAEAVAGLVRQLELESAGKTPRPDANVEADWVETDEKGTARSGIGKTHAPATQIPPPPEVESASYDERRSVCAECGHANPESYSFCGMCGVPLVPLAETRLADSSPGEPWTQKANFGPRGESHSFDRAGEFSAQEETAAHESVNGDRAEIGQETSGIETEDKVNQAAERYDTLFPPQPTPDTRDEFFSRARIKENDLPQFARPAESVPYRFRIYLGLAIAVIFGALIYMARRGDVFSGSQQSPAVKALPAQPATPGPEASEPPGPPAVEKVEKSEAAQRPSPAATKSQEIPPKTAAAPSTPRPKLQPPAVPASMTAQTPIAGTSQTGAEELAEAQKNLSGSIGNRTGAEAEQWLWKAVAKGNGSAALTLSDLYLHGSGIAQNCDQARLLLDVAAKKGVKGAAERLRNMQAFGCR